MQATIRIGAAALLSLALSGCLGLGGAKPPPTLFTLTANHAVAAGAGTSGKVADALVVMEPETDRRLGVARVAVQVDDANVAYLQKAMWVERPSRLFRALLAETLRAKGTRLVFEDSETAAVGARRLSGRLIDMGYDAREMAVVVRFDALRDLGAGQVATRRFESVVKGVPAKPEAVGPALNRAANEVAQQVADWVG